MEKSAKAPARWHNVSSFIDELMCQDSLACTWCVANTNWGRLILSCTSLCLQYALLYSNVRLQASRFGSRVIRTFAGGASLRHLLNAGMLLQSKEPFTQPGVLCQDHVIELAVLSCMRGSFQWTGLSPFIEFQISALLCSASFANYA